MSGSQEVRDEWTAGGVVVRDHDGMPHVLLIRDPYRNWGLPKGHLEEGEDAGAAALREVREETGLEALEMGPHLGSISWYFRRERVLVRKVCSFFLMHSSQGSLVPQVAEGITECVWLPLEDAVARITYDNAREMLQAAARHLDGGEAAGLSGTHSTDPR